MTCVCVRERVNLPKPWTSNVYSYIRSMHKNGTSLLSIRGKMDLMLSTLALQAFLAAFRYAIGRTMALLAFSSTIPVYSNIAHQKLIFIYKEKVPVRTENRALCRNSKLKKSSLLFQSRKHFDRTQTMFRLNRLNIIFSVHFTSNEIFFSSTTIIIKFAEITKLPPDFFFYHKIYDPSKYGYGWDLDEKSLGQFCDFRQLEKSFRLNKKKFVGSKKHWENDFF